MLRCGCKAHGDLGKSILNTIVLDEEVKEIIHKLQKAGYEAYAVGGAIRDSLMGLRPSDWDITTSATPLQVKEIFKYTIDTGLAHGTVTVRLHKKSFEVTTYRIDGKYDDNRHPNNVKFTSNLQEDLKRRDFTINAMAYNDVDGLVDIYGGRRDLELGIIRCVGEPNERFKEDSLRTLRAIRFVAKTGFRLHRDTAKAITCKAELLKNVSAERIRQELNYIITSDRPEVLLLAYELGLTKIILPELDLMLSTEQNNPHHFTDVGSHSLISMKYVPAIPILRWTMLLHDVGKPAMRTTDENGIDHFKRHGEKSVEIAKAVLTGLKFDNDTVKRVLRLVKHHDDRMVPDKKFLRRFYNILGEDMSLMFEVQKADIMAHTDHNMETVLDRLALSYKLFTEIVADKEAVKIADLDINGNDLMALGIPKGRLIGEILSKLLDRVLEEPCLNVKENLIKMAMELRDSINERK